MNIRSSVAVLAAASLLSPPSAFAVSTPPPADTSAIFSIMDENASISSGKLTDRYYTNGLQLGWMSPTDYAPQVAGLGRVLFGEGRQRVAIDITQQIYTPANTVARVPPKGDRPYAGVLAVRLSQVTDTATSRGTVGMSLGVLGPAALGEQVQNGFHDLIGQGHNNGWRSQLPNQPVVELDVSQVWRMPLGTLVGLETDVLPAAGVAVGTLRIAADAGVNVRIGQGLENDYGAPRVGTHLGGGTAFQRSDSLGWYVFAGIGGQLVGRDLTLNGAIGHDTAQSVSINPAVAQGQLGFAVLYRGARLSYTQVIQSQEFKHQHGGPHQMGALALSVRF